MASPTIPWRQGRSSQVRLASVKILHTADWHAGRSLHGVDRTPEVEAALQEIAELAVRERVDLILVAGDLFDSKNPSAAAEEAVFGFFLLTGRAGIPSVVIAGNHDSPARLDAVGGILKLAHVRAVGRPLVAGQGGTFELWIAGERVRVAALPFISERRIVKVQELLTGDAGQHREGYRQGMRKLIGNLTQDFTPDAINLLLLHTTMEGATLANSEYVFHSTESYTLSPDLLPEAASYVALGHMHKSQPVPGFAASRARYSGSILQLDFGEQGDDKGVLLLNVAPGQPTELLEEVSIRSGRRLRRVRLGLEELERRTPELAAFDGWLKLAIDLDTPRPGVKERIRSALPNVLTVELNLPEAEERDERGVDLEHVTLSEAYGQYYLREKGQDLPKQLGEAFRELYERIADAELSP